MVRSEIEDDCDNGSVYRFGLNFLLCEHALISPQSEPCRRRHSTDHFAVGQFYTYFCESSNKSYPIEILTLFSGRF